MIERARARQTMAKRAVLVAPAVAALFGAAEVVSLTLSPGTIAAGANSTATVLTSGLATSGLTVARLNLSSSNTAVATVPATGTIDGKTNKATVTVHGVSGAAGCSVISAKIGTGIPKTATVFVTPPTATGLLRVSVPGSGAVGGTTVNGSLLWMAAPTGSGIVVNLSSNSPNATVPATVTIPPSAVNETGVAVVQFPIQTSVVAPTTCAVITGTSGSSTARALLKIVTISG
jgi:hypothetical protein